MSETQDPSDGSPASGGAGAILRKARERTGLHIGALSVALKVPVQRLEALEADRLDLLPGPVFVRALALSVCRHLKIDPQQVLPLLPQAAQPVLHVDGTLNEPFRSPSHVGPARAWPRVSRPALMAAASLAVAASLVFFWPQTKAPRDKGAGKQSPEAVVTEPVQPARPLPAAPEPAAPGPAAALPGNVAGQSAAGPSAALQPAIAQPPESALLLFKAHKPTWVEVIDSGGQVVLRRVIEAGEQVPVQGAPRLRVTVGNVEGVAVFVRGSPMDLGPIAQSNLARFEVQ